MTNQTAAERVTRMRKRKRMKTLSITAEALAALAEYQRQHELPNRSVAIKHAVAFARPE